MYNSGYSIKKSFFRLTGLVVLVLLIHAFVLRFIFPGYYSPLNPHSSDFYIPVALANSPTNFFQYSYLGYSRALGIFFLKLIGFLGIQGSILFTVFNVAVNVSLTAMLVRCILNIEFSIKLLLTFCLYCFLLFSQPHFYIFYTQDLLAHLSYFFLISGVCIFYLFHIRSKKLAYTCLFCFSTIGFLCKETYILTALFLALTWFFYFKTKSRREVISPFLVIAGATVATLVFNFIVKSIFVNFGSGLVTDDYYINLRPVSVINQMIIYARDGFNYLHCLILLIIAVTGVYYIRSGEKSAGYISLACLIAAFLSWVPNALLPNHHHAGYSFNGLYLLYLPVVFIPIRSQGNILLKYAIVVLFVLSLASPLFNQKEYKKHTPILAQESTQRNLLRSLDLLIGELNPEKEKQAILLTGLRMPFYPFHHPLSLKEYPNSKYANFDVVNYTIEEKGKRDYSVQFVPPAGIRLGQYDEIWMFAVDGTLIRKLLIDPLTVEVIEKSNYSEMIIYPDSAKNQRLSLIIK